MARQGPALTRRKLLHFGSLFGGLFVGKKHLRSGSCKARFAERGRLANHPYHPVGTPFSYFRFPPAFS